MNNKEKLESRLASSEPMKWVMAGDSITHGALHTMGWRDYTELFSERLRWEMGRMRDCVIKTAVSGWTIKKLAEDLQWSVSQYRPDVVSIALGTNDCVGGAGGVAEFRAGLIDPVRRVGDTGAIVILQTPMRILPADAVRTPHLPSYVEAVASAAAETGAILVDHYTAWSQAEQSGTIAYWLSDAIHPNECGHRVMARTMLEAIGCWDPASNTGRLFVP
jgi:acyl-CoA thioesterase-1